MLSLWAAMKALGDSDRRLPGPLVGRIEADATSALRRKPAQESQLAGAFRALAPHCGELVQILGKAIATLVQRGSQSSVPSPHTPGGASVPGSVPVSGVVSTTVTTCVALLAFPHRSVAVQVRYRV